MALAAGMLSWAVSRALGHPENLSFCFPLLMGSYILLLDMNGFFLKRHTTGEGTRGFNLLFAFMLHLYWAPVSTTVDLSTPAPLPAS